MKFYGDIAKYEELSDGTLLVSGIASTEDRDNQGEVVTADAIRKAIPAYMKSPSAREMHQPIAAGKTVEMDVADDGRTYAKVHVVDRDTVAKVKAGVLRGFSIGGAALKRIGNTIHELILKELSLVDSPCNPKCLFNLAKFDNPDPDFMPDPTNAELVQKLDALTSTVNTLAQTVKTLAEAPAPAAPGELIAKVDGKDVRVSVTDVTALIQKVAGFETELTKTREGVTEGAKADLIAKMDSEGRAPMNPETNKAYTLDELKKCDLATLKILSANSPRVPLTARSPLIAKVDGNPAIDPKLKGSDRTQAVWDQKYPNLATARG